MLQERRAGSQPLPVPAGLWWARRNSDQRNSTQGLKSVLASLESGYLVDCTVVGDGVSVVPCLGTLKGPQVNAMIFGIGYPKQTRNSNLS